jgi:hypothetical protein
MFNIVKEFEVKRTSSPGFRNFFSGGAFSTRQITLHNKGPGYAKKVPRNSTTTASPMITTADMELGTKGR